MRNQIVETGRGEIIMARPDRFTGKVAVVTGAASGIGRAAAIAFAVEGALVVVIDRNDDALLEVEAAVKAAGGEALAQTCDISAPARCGRRSPARSTRSGGSMSRST